MTRKYIFWLWCWMVFLALRFSFRFSSGYTCWNPLYRRLDCSRVPSRVPPFHYHHYYHYYYYRCQYRLYYRFRCRLRYCCRVHVNMIIVSVIVSSDAMNSLPYDESSLRAASSSSALRLSARLSFNHMLCQEPVQLSAVLLR